MNIIRWAVFHVNCCIAQLVVDPHFVELDHRFVTHRLPWGGIAFVIARQLAEFNHGQHHLGIFMTIETGRRTASKITGTDRESDAWMESNNLTEFGK